MLETLRKIRLEQARKEKAAIERSEFLQKSEARPMFRLFDKEYLPGKGMRDGGSGSVIVGNHYKIKQQNIDKEAESEKNKLWLENYQKKMRNAKIA